MRARDDHESGLGTSSGPEPGAVIIDSSRPVLKKQRLTIPKGRKIPFQLFKEAD
jgi:hypothetical protein